MAAAENVGIRRALIAIAVLSLGLWFVEIDTAFGLPAHPLFLHVPVVFVPILTLAALALAAGKLDDHRIPLAAFSVLTLIAVFLTAGAGEALRAEREAEIQDKATLASHADSGDALRYAMVLLTAALLASLFTKRTHVVLRIVIALLAIHALFWVIRTGHLGSELVWNT
ncbi:MAG TPA: hypothetical protein VFZ00_25535 [Solirubrobacter sp.]|jgi:hypothetical protein|nr:hypothetical protein [Solirubrobacter sp.]